MRIIPAIDLIEGKCVRLTRGDYSTKKIYDSSPLDVAKRFEDAGIQFLHLVDLDGAKSGRVVNFAALESIASKTNLTIDFGGGVKSKSDLINVFNAGASQITAGSIAVKNPDEVEQWIKEFGPEKIILGADYKQRKIAIQGWEEQSDLDIGDFISTYLSKGIKYAICTDISKDGMLEGPSLEIYTELISTIDIQLIASGGITSLEDLQQLKAIGCEGAIIGKAIYEGKITLKELEQLC